MNRAHLRGIRQLLAILVLSAAPGLTLGAQSDSLRVGDLFPPLVGPSLSGKPIALPDTTASRYAVVVFGFSKAGGDDARRWNERLAGDSAVRARANVLVVAELGGAPRLFRGLISAGIRKGTPPNVRDGMMILDHDDALWKRRLAVTETSHSYAVLLSPKGRITWKSDGPFDDARLARLRNELINAPGTSASSRP
jgi:hypothetical protein